MELLAQMEHLKQVMELVLLMDKVNQLAFVIQVTKIMQTMHSTVFFLVNALLQTQQELVANV